MPSDPQRVSVSDTRESASIAWNTPLKYVALASRNSSVDSVRRRATTKTWNPRHRRVAARCRTGSRRSVSRRNTRLWGIASSAVTSTNQVFERGKERNLLTSAKKNHPFFAEGLPECVPQACGLLDLLEPPLERLQVLPGDKYPGVRPECDGDATRRPAETGGQLHHLSAWHRRGSASPASRWGTRLE